MSTSNTEMQYCKNRTYLPLLKKIIWVIGLDSEDGTGCRNISQK